MRNLKESSEIISNPFKIGDVIACPSDLTKTESNPTGILWEVYKINEKDGTVFAKVQEGQPISDEYPKTIEIVPHSYNGWKKVI